MNQLLKEMEFKIGRSLNMLAGKTYVSYMETTLHEHDKEKWLVFGNLEIRICVLLEYFLNSKKAAKWKNSLTKSYLE